MRLFKNVKEAFPEVALVWQPLPDDEYVKAKTVKLGGRLMLHCTQGSTVRYLGGKGGIWDTDKLGPIATMFSIEKDGTIYQYFDEDFWAYASGCGAEYDKKSIHVEMGNRAFIKNVNGKYFWMAGAKWVPYEGTPVRSTAPFQGYTYWDPYPEEQVAAMAKLAAYLIYNHGIPLEFHNDIRYIGPNQKQKGVLSHSNVSLQRCDPGPAFPYGTFEELTRKHFLELCNKHGYPVHAKK